MKLILMTLVLLISLPVFAAFTEVECTGQSNGQNISTAVDEGFQGSYRRAMVQAGSDTKTFNVMSRGSFGNRVRYEGSNYQLEVDFWPDARPQWARTYRGTFFAQDMNINNVMMWCRFPNIRP